MIRVTRELHETPPAVEARLRLAGGTNRFGKPNYRAIWGWNRLSWIGGKWEDRDAAGNVLREVVELRQEPKYAPMDRWHIERWHAAEKYGSPREWYAQTMERADGISIPALGPYPEHGEYELAFTIQTPDGEFVQITSAIAERLARMIESGDTRSSAERRAALDRRMEAAEREYDTYAKELLDSTDSAFDGQPFVGVI